MNYLIGGALLVVAAAFGWVAVRRVRADARRFSNAAWMIAALLTGIIGLASCGFGLLLSALVLLVIFAPLLGFLFAAFLVYNGTVMLRREGHSLANLLSLLAGISLLCAIATGFVLIIWNIDFFPLALWIALSCIWAAILFFSFIGYAAFYQLLVARSRPAYLIVLGCGLIGEKVSPLLQSRIDKALQTRADLPAGHTPPLLVMSGGQGRDEPISEAAAMRSYALARQLPPREVLVETRSQTTAENLRYSAAVLRAHLQLAPEAQLPAGVAVTSNYHALRAAMLARGLHLPIDVLGAPTAGYFWPSATLREFVAVIKGAWRWHLVSYLLLTCVPSLLFAFAFGGN